MMSKSNIGRIQHKALISYCTQEFQVEIARNSYAEVSTEKISQLGTDSEPLCLEGVAPGENQENEG